MCIWKEQNSGISVHCLMTALSSRSLLHAWTFLFESLASLLGVWFSARHWEFWRSGTVLFSLGPCFPHCDAQALLETQSKVRCLEVQLFLSAPRTHREEASSCVKLRPTFKDPRSLKFCCPQRIHLFLSLSNTVLTETCYVPSSILFTI